MTDEPINSLLEHLLRAIRSDLMDQRELIRDLGGRVARIDLSLSGLYREQALRTERAAHVEVRMDRMKADIDRIKIRLDPREA